MNSCLIRFVLCSLAAVLTALPVAPIPLDFAVSMPCLVEYARCIDYNKDAKRCHDFVCSTYGEEVRTRAHMYLRH